MKPQLTPIRSNPHRSSHPHLHPLLALLTLAAALILFAVPPTITRAYEEGDPPPEDYTPPTAHSPAESLALIHIADGFTIELVAAEPLIADPVAFDWDTQGRLYVAQMNDYPNGSDSNGSPGGRVQLLHDDNGDGTYDRADTFLENLNFPNGIKTWRNGVLITAAPDILYAEDTTGDGHADHIETLYTGFTEGNQQHRANGLRWGIDGWLYLANGDSGGTVKSLKTGQVVDIRGSDLRIKPDQGLIQAVEGQAQFGRNRDDFNNWFGGNNSNPMWHYVLPAHYLQRNPHVSYPSVHRDVSIAPGPSPVYPASNAAQRFNDPDRINRFTSASSHMIVRDTRLGDLHGDALITEPVHNLVRREHMQRDGYTFTSIPAASQQSGEFFASADPWSRPVMARTGPDGAVYIADMYRLVIEHPKWIPEPWQKVLDLRAGSNMGRIYRIYQSDRTLNTMPTPNLPQQSAQTTTTRSNQNRTANQNVNLAAQYPWTLFRDSPSTATLLATAMRGPNGWTRDKAQELILQLESDSNDAAVAAHQLRKPAFGESAISDTFDYSTSDAGRVQALHTLAAMNRLLIDPNDPNDRQRRNQSTLQQQLSGFVDDNAIPDSDPQIIAALIRLTEPYINDNDTIAQTALLHINHPDTAVTLQLAFTLGEWQDPRAGRALAQILINHADDEYITAAAISSAVPHTTELMRALTAHAAANPNTLPILAEPIAKLIQTAAGTGNTAAIQRAVDALFPPGKTDLTQPSTLRLLAALIESAATANNLTQLAGPERAQRINLIIDDARNQIESAMTDTVPRQLLITLLARQTRYIFEDINTLASLIKPSEPQGIQLAAIRRLSQLDRDSAADALLAAYPAATPAVRAAIFESLISRGNWAIRTLHHLRQNPTLIPAFGPSQKQRLLSHDWTVTRDLAAEVFADSTNSIDLSRAAVIANYANASQLTGNPANGITLFQQHCATCHQLNNVGNPIGPDLSALSDYTTPSLLTAILDPNAAVEDKYRTYLVTLNDGRALVGIISNESGGSLTLTSPDGQQHPLTRNTITNLAPTGLSLMTQGLEAALNPQAAADLIAYLRQTARQSD